jgi:hypothetical protein
MASAGIGSGTHMTGELFKPNFNSFSVSSAASATQVLDLA